MSAGAMSAGAMSDWAKAGVARARIRAADVARFTGHLCGSTEVRLASCSAPAILPNHRNSAKQAMTTAADRRLELECRPGQPFGPHRRHRLRLEERGDA